LSSNPDVKSITQEFLPPTTLMTLTACWLFALTAHKGVTLPYGKNSVMPVRGGLEKIWRGFPKAVPDFGVEIIEMIPGEENTIVVQALLGGTMPADVAGLVKKGEVGRIAHAYNHPLRQRRKNLAPGLLLGQHRYQRHKGKRLVSDLEKTQ